VAGELRVIDTRQVDQVDEAVVLEGAADVDDPVALDEERQLTSEVSRAGHRVVDAGDGGRHQRIALDVVDAARRRGSGRRSRRRRRRRGWG